MNMFHIYFFQSFKSRSDGASQQNLLSRNQLLKTDWPRNELLTSPWWFNKNRKMSGSESDLEIYHFFNSPNNFMLFSLLGELKKKLSIMYLKTFKHYTRVITLTKIQSNKGYLFTPPYKRPGIK